MEQTKEEDLKQREEEVEKKKAELQKKETQLTKTESEIRNKEGQLQKALANLKKRQGIVNQLEVEEMKSRRVDILSNQLSNAVSKTATEDQIIWTIFSVFWAANSVLLVALYVTGKPPDPVVGGIISIVGLAISVVWYLIQRRAIRWFMFYEDLVSRLQEHLIIPKEFSVLTIPKENKTFEGSIRVRTIMEKSPAVTAVLWGISAIIFFFWESVWKSVWAKLLLVC